jgi:SAM-dependent methyltransferase
LDPQQSLSQVSATRSADRSAKFPNIQFQPADVAVWDFPVEYFDCLATIATLHHVPLREVLLKMKAALRPGGVLMILDLFEPEGLVDSLANIVAIGVSGTLRLINNGRLKPPREVQAAWEEHGQHDSYPTMNEMHRLCAEILPGANIRKHLLWRYSIIWRKRACQNPER